MTALSFIIPNVSLLLESVEKLSSLACPLGAKVCIHLGDCKIKDAKQESALLERTQQRILWREVKIMSDKNSTMHIGQLQNKGEICQL